MLLEQEAPTVESARIAKTQSTMGNENASVPEPKITFKDFCACVAAAHPYRYRGRPRIARAADMLTHAPNLSDRDDAYAYIKHLHGYPERLLTKGCHQDIGAAWKLWDGFKRVTGGGS